MEWNEDEELFFQMYTKGLLEDNKHQLELFEKKLRQEAEWAASDPLHWAADLYNVCMLRVLLPRVVSMNKAKAKLQKVKT